MTFHCTTCEVNWWPYQTLRGQCLRCGGGTRMTQEAPSAHVHTLYREACDARHRLERRERFEEYYLRRELARGPDAWKTP
jgi:hypothetical protein